MCRKKIEFQFTWQMCLVSLTERPQTLIFLIVFWGLGLCTARMLIVGKKTDEPWVETSWEMFSKLVGILVGKMLVQGQKAVMVLIVHGTT